jgi:hypothetical protein
MMLRLFWPCWLLASVTTGLVAGFMLGHALVLGRFLEWMLATDPGRLAAAYPAFARSVGAAGLSVFYAVCGVQVVAAVALLALSLGARRHRLAAGVAASAAVLWIAVHYTSGFGAVETLALRSTSAVSPDVTRRFLAMNTPVHLAHAAVLLIGLVALLALPLGRRQSVLRHGTLPAGTERGSSTGPESTRIH